MKRTSMRPTNVAIIVMIVLGIVLFTQAQAMAEYVQHALTLHVGPIATPRGPAADPYLRHVPGGYDYELEPPPEELP